MKLNIIKTENTKEDRLGHANTGQFQFYSNTFKREKIIFVPTALLIYS